MGLPHGAFLGDKTYGLNSSISVEQGIGYINNSPVAGLSSHLNLLEDFSPYRTGDAFHWIPQGLFYDMMDTRNENSPVVDQVSGYTNQQMFSTFQSNIYTLQDYKMRLLQTMTNPTSIDWRRYAAKVTWR